MVVEKTIYFVSWRNLDMLTGHAPAQEHIVTCTPGRREEAYVRVYWTPRPHGYLVRLSTIVCDPVELTTMLKSKSHPNGVSG